MVLAWACHQPCIVCSMAVRRTHWLEFLHRKSGAMQTAKDPRCRPPNITYLAITTYDFALQHLRRTGLLKKINIASQFDAERPLSPCTSAPVTKSSSEGFRSAPKLSRQAAYPDSEDRIDLVGYSQQKDGTDTVQLLALQEKTNHRCGQI